MATTPNPLKIIIVGAGIAGLTLAKALEEIPPSASSPPIEYIVLEGRPELAPQQGAGIALAPGGSRILDQLGVYAGLEDQMAPVSSSAVHDVHGKLLLPARSDAALLVGRRMGYPFGLVERRNVVLALLRGLKRKKECVITGKRVVRVEHEVDQDKPVTVVCADGSRYEGDVVVGADGVRSKIREEMWGAVEKRVCRSKGFDVQRERDAMTAEYRCLFGLSSPVPGYAPGCSDDTIGKDVSTMVATSKGGQVFWFLFGRLDRVYKNGEIPRFSAQETAAFAQQHANLPVQGGITMGQLWKSRRTATLVPLEEADYRLWTAGRFVIIGDGAHKMTPQTGSGGMLAIDHAAALANILHMLNSARGNSKPLTTRAIENALSEFDTRRRHIRTTALIRQAGALARLQALRTPLDRIAAALLFPRAGDARADQLCGDAVGAARIEYLPLPRRSLQGTMPFNPELGIGLGESKRGRALRALPLLLLALGGFLSMAAVVPLEGAAQVLNAGVYRWASSNGTQVEDKIPETFYGVPMVDEFARLGVMRFIISRAHFMLQNLSLFADYGVWYAIMLVEASRRSLRLTIVQCALLWGLLNLKGIAIFVPIYYFAHYIVSPMSAFGARDMRLTDTNQNKTILPVLLVAHYAPFLTAYLSPSSSTRQTAAFLWELFPIWIAAMQYGQSDLVPSTSLQDRLIPHPTRDLPSIRRTIIPLVLFSAAVWQYTLWTSPSISEALQLFSPITSGVDSMTFAELFAETLKWDQVFFGFANEVWIVLLFWDMKRAGYIRRSWVSLIGCAVAVTVLGGNGALLGVAWLYREEMLVVGNHWAAVVADMEDMVKG
ncbi:hypothetical protein BJX68DRAFT_267254 [Aspergillus pseudodeflectus]|uniref:FAD-binding domain-containing protein n=1 Tax=Aspergillus pseudodeflectus TaxID=176178 RepID=A0ABR4KDU6_9EURO